MCLIENGICCTQELFEHTTYEIQEDAHSFWRCINDSNCAKADWRWENQQVSSTYRTKKQLHPTEFHDISIQ
jgi:hypothetical protein